MFKAMIVVIRAIPINVLLLNYFPIIPYDSPIAIMTEATRENGEVIYSLSDMFKLDGRRRDTYLYYLDGWKYHLEIRDKNSSNNENNKVWRCVHRKRDKCSAKVEAVLDQKLKYTGVHKCTEDKYCIQEAMMYQQLQHDALFTDEKPHRNLNRVSMMPEFKDVLHRLEPTRANSIIRRARFFIRDVPDNLEDLAVILENDSTNPLSKFYRGSVKFTDGDGSEQVALLFASDDMIKQLNTVRKLFIDGIMKLISENLIPHLEQLHSVLGARGELGDSGKSISDPPGVLAVCTGAPWFPRLAVTVPPRNLPLITVAVPDKAQRKKTPVKEHTRTDSTGSTIKSGAAAFFGAMGSDWFSAS